jgi:hypothetical protein
MILVHDVYFTLHDPSEEAKARFVQACLQHLSGHEGCLAMSAGTCAPEFDRPVNDRAFDVALHLTFADKAAHDAYQEHPRHKRFLEEIRPNRKQVRVFDSWVAVPAGKG